MAVDAKMTRMRTWATKVTSWRALHGEGVKKSASQVLWSGYYLARTNNTNATAYWFHMHTLYISTYNKGGKKWNRSAPRHSLTRLAFDRDLFDL